MKVVNIKLLEFIDEHNIPCYNGLLMYRPNAYQAKNAIISHINQFVKKEHQILLHLDFSNVKTIDISFADEVIFSTKIELSKITEIQSIIVVSGDGFLFEDELLPTIKAAQLLRQQIEREKSDNKPIYLPIFVLKNSDLVILGDFEDKLFDIYDQAINTNGSTAREMSERLNISLRNAGTQAMKLVKLGLVFRESDIGPNGKYNIFKKISVSLILS